jgi:hypothetical protein
MPLRCVATRCTSARGLRWNRLERHSPKSVGRVVRQPPAVTYGHRQPHILCVVRSIMFLEQQLDVRGYLANVAQAVWHSRWNRSRTALRTWTTYISSTGWIVSLQPLHRLPLPISTAGRSSAGMGKPPRRILSRVLSIRPWVIGRQH